MNKARQRNFVSVQLWPSAEILIVSLVEGKQVPQEPNWSARLEAYA